MSKNSALFSLQINKFSPDLGITMKMHAPILGTSKLPHTYSMLESQLPSILRSHCFNNKNQAFSKEVLDTEIGHLFEHILLEYLTKLKFLYDNKSVSFKGFTYWDWKKEEQGLFHIRIKAKTDVDHLLEEAVDKSIALLNGILENRLVSVN